MDYKKLLEKLIEEINLANDGATTKQEFCTMTMQAVDLADRVSKGLETMPKKWQD